MNAANRYFEVIVNQNFFFPAYTLVMNDEKKALAQAVREAKFNQNSFVQIIEVDDNGEMLENGYMSPIKKLS